MRTVSIVIALSLLTVGSSHAQVSKETLESITTPDTVETSIGTLNFMDGAPSPDTAQKVYDYLDTMRGVDAFLKGMPGVSLYGIVDGPARSARWKPTRSSSWTRCWIPSRST
jgi:hypothetical protein